MESRNVLGGGGVLEGYQYLVKDGRMRMTKVLLFAMVFGFFW